MPIEGTYIVSVGIDKDETIRVPMIISRKPADLYGACSPKNPWWSSLTFEPGKPIEYDIHGAEETLAGYIRLGTRVAFFPAYEHLRPPWFGRMFLHATMNPNVFVPQPPYAQSRVYSVLLHDAVKTALYNEGYNSDWGYCGFRYKGIYVDDVSSFPITGEEVVNISERWDSQDFVRKVR